MKPFLMILSTIAVMAMIAWATKYKDPYVLRVNRGKWRKDFTLIMITNQATYKYGDGKYGTNVPPNTSGTLLFMLGVRGENPKPEDYDPITDVAGTHGLWESYRPTGNDYQSTEASIQWDISPLEGEGGAEG